MSLVQYLRMCRKQFLRTGYDLICGVKIEYKVYVQARIWNNPGRRKYEWGKISIFASRWYILNEMVLSCCFANTGKFLWYSTAEVKCRACETCCQLIQYSVRMSQKRRQAYGLVSVRLSAHNWYESSPFLWNSNAWVVVSSPFRF